MALTTAMHRKNNLRAYLLPAVLLAAVVAWGQPDPPAEQKTSAFSGVVSNSVTGEPIAHAHLRLDANSGPGRANYGVMTNADGRFSIQTIPPGKYDLFVERRGYGLLAASQENSETIELKPGSEIKDFVVQLVPDAVISGRVLDVNGVPMAGIDVRAVGRGRPLWAQTNDLGQFRIGQLHPGRYLVKALSDQLPLPPEIRTDGTKAISYGPTYYPRAATAKSAAPVQAQAGQETSGIEIKLLTAPILHVSGAVSNVPKTARSVVVEFVNGLAQRGHSVGSDRTFTAWRVPPGRYQVFAAYFDSAGKYVRSAPTEITVTSTDIEGVNLVCTQPIELTGQVRVEGTTLVTAQGQTRPSIKLQPLGSLEHAEQDEDINDDAGFKMTYVLPGRYRVIAEDFPQGYYVKSVRLGEKEFADGILDLGSAAPKAHLTVLLGNNGAEIAGVVRDPKEPAPHIHVALFFDDEYGADLADTTDTGADGSYAFHGIAPGKYKLLAYDLKSAGAGWSSEWSSEALTLYDTVIERVEVSAADKIAQDLKLQR